MSGIKSLLKSSGGQLLILIVAILIFYLSAPAVDTIQDIEISEGYAYLALGEHGIRVLNIADPDNPIEVDKYNTIGFTHDVTVKGKFLFAADGVNGALVFDISNPAEIVYLWRYDKSKDTHAITLWGEYAYLADSVNGLHILKTTQFPPPQAEQYSWSISGDGLKEIATTGNHIYGVGLDNAVRIYDASKPTNPQAISSVPIGAEINDLSVWDSTVFVATNGLGVSWFKHPSNNMELPSGTFPMEGKNISSIDAYANSAYLGVAGSGIEILDITNLNAVATIASAAKNVILQPTAINYQDGIAYVADGIKGLRLLQLDDQYLISAINVSGSQSGINGSVEDIRVLDNFVYMANCQHGLNILRLGDNHQVQGQYQLTDTTGCAVALDAIKNSLIVAVQGKGIRIYDVAENRAAPKLVYDIGTNGAARDVVVKDHYAFIANGTAGLAIVDWEIPVDQVISQLNLGNSADAQGIHIYGDYAYLATGDGGLKIVNIADPRQPALVATQHVPGYIKNVYLHPALISNSEGASKLYAFVVGGAKDEPSGLWVYDVSDPRNSNLVGVYDVAEPVVDISIDGRAAYLLLENHGLITLDISDPATPQLKWAQGVEGYYSQIYRIGRQVYVGRKTQGIQVFQMDNIEVPNIVMEFSSGSLSLKDVIVVDGYAFAVDGQKGLWVIDIRNPSIPSIVEFIDTPGEARSLALINGQLFLADGGRGIRAFDIQNRAKPVLIGSFEAMEQAMAIAGKGEFAYVANSHGGMVAFHIGDPTKIEPIGFFKTRAAALDIALFGDIVYIPEGNFGVEVVNVSNPSRPIGVTVTNDFSLANALSAEISLSHTRLFVADGEHGLKVYDISNPSNPAMIFSLASNDRLQDVSLMSNIAYLADSRGGIRTVIFLTNDQVFELEGIPSYAQNIYWTDLAADKAEESHLLVYGDQGGLSTYKFERKYQIALSGFFETPGRSAFRDLIFGLPISPRARTNLSMLAGSILAYVLAQNFMFALLSGLILPIRTRGYSKDVFDRMKSFIQGAHGPVIFAENGQTAQSPEGFKKGGLGFIKVSADSAIVLERIPSQPGFLGGILNALKRRHPRENLSMRTEGPGFVFTNGGERVRGVVDLRRQIRLRPQVRAHTRDGIEVSCVVIALSTLGEKPDVLQVCYANGEQRSENIRVVRLGFRSPDQERNQNYRLQIISKLEDILDPEDKIEIHRFVQGYKKKEVIVEESPDEKKNGWRAYTYIPKRVFAAVTGRPYDVDADELQDWTEIPPFIAVNIFREILSQKLYDEILEPTQSGKFPFKDLKNQLRNRMVNQGILAFKFIEMKDGSAMEEGQEWYENRVDKYPVQELKARKVLRSRGIKVIFAGVSELQPVIDDVQEYYMYEHWRAPWQKEAVITQADHELQAMRLKNLARAQAQQDMAFTLAKILQSHEHSREALAVRVYQALETVAANPNTQRLLPRDTIYIMRNLRTLLLPDDGDKKLPSLDAD